jgi:hypothetical protein
VFTKILDYRKKIICRLINSTQDSLNSVTKKTAYGALRNIMHRLPRHSLFYKYFTVSRYTRRLNVITFTSARKCSLLYADFHETQKSRNTLLKLIFIHIGLQICKIWIKVYLHPQVKDRFH